MHTFIGISLPTELQQKISKIASEWQPFSPLKKWTREGDFHITLQFLGDTTTEQVEALKETFSKIKTGSPFEINLKGIGIFGKPNAPRVLYVKVNPNEPLVKVQQVIADGCKKQGFVSESRPYTPHITLGKRFDDKRNISVFENEILNQGEFLSEESFKVTHFHLFRIHPQREKKYEIIHSWNVRED